MSDAMIIDVYSSADGVVLRFGDEYEALLTVECAENLLNGIKESLADVALIRRPTEGEA